MKAVLFCLLILLASLQTAFAAEAPISDDSQTCLDCHSLFSPGIVEGWKKSRHASVTPAQAMSADKLALKVSSEAVPEELRDVAVGCAECHTLRPEAHKDTFDHNGYDTHVVVSPKDCATCHAVETSQYDKNLMAHALSLIHI